MKLTQKSMLQSSLTVRSEDFCTIISSFSFFSLYHFIAFTANEPGKKTKKLHLEMDAIRFETKTFLIKTRT